MVFKTASDHFDWLNGGSTIKLMFATEGYNLAARIHFSVIQLIRVQLNPNPLLLSGFESKLKTLLISN